MVKYGLKPILTKLDIPTRFAGLDAFPHGLATELADRSTPLPVLQKQMRHSDVRTMLRVYAHAIPQTQRDAVEAISIGTVPSYGTRTESKCFKVRKLAEARS
jgi:integrase